MATESPKRGDERGATLVEFAIITPLLVLLVFGIIDFGWMFANHQDVRHGSREAVRLAAVNYDDTSTPTSGDQPEGCGPAGTPGEIQAARIVCETKARTGSIDDDQTSVLIQLDCGSDANGDGNPCEIGESVVVRVCYPMDTVSGVTDIFIPDDAMLRSKAEMRLEQEPTFTANWDGSTPCP